MVLLYDACPLWSLSLACASCIVYMNDEWTNATENRPQGVSTMPKKTEKVKTWTENK